MIHDEGDNINKDPYIPLHELCSVAKSIAILPCQLPPCCPTLVKGGELTRNGGWNTLGKIEYKPSSMCDYYTVLQGTIETLLIVEPVKPICIH